jgi:ribosome recycling factor
MPNEETKEILDSCRASMDKTVGNLQAELAKVRTGRASPGLLDGVMVDYYGAPTPLKKLATVSAPEPRLLVVQPFDASSVAAIEKGIMRSDLGLMPRKDGKLIRVPIPELTGERRKELVKHIKHVAEEHKQSVRHERRDALALLKELEKDGAVDEDEARRTQKAVQDMTDAHCAKIDEHAARKEKEILTV